MRPGHHTHVPLAVVYRIGDAVIVVSPMPWHGVLMVPHPHPCASELSSVGSPLVATEVVTAFAFGAFGSRHKWRPYTLQPCQNRRHEWRPYTSGIGDLEPETDRRDNLLMTRDARRRPNVAVTVMTEPLGSPVGGSSE